jgi:Lon protease-like protein
MPTTDSRTLGMFPLSTVLFPCAGLPLHVFEDRYRALMADCLAADGEFGVVLIARGSEVGGGDERVDVGTLARVDQVAELADGRLLVVARGARRVRVATWLPDEPYPRAVVDELPMRQSGNHDLALATAEVSVRRLRSLLSELEDVPALPSDLEVRGTNEEIAWKLCELAPLNLMDRQQLLASTTLEEQLHDLVGLCEARSDDVVAMLAAGFED